MASYTQVSNGWQIGTASAIDRRFLLTKNQMLNEIYDDGTSMVLPDPYFTLCTEDNRFYCYSTSNPYSNETGYFKLMINPRGYQVKYTASGATVTEI